MEFSDILSIITAVTLFLLFLRDVIVGNTTKDYSKDSRPLLRWLFSNKEKVTAKIILNELGLSREDVIRKIKGEKKRGYQAAIKFLSECIIKADGDNKYEFGSENASKHQSQYYVDSQGYSHDEDNCNKLYNIITDLIDKVGIDKDYKYVFSIKGGNIPLAVKFTKYSKIPSIMPKEKNEIVTSISSSDFEIRYEGFSLLKKLAENNPNEVKGIAVTCNLSNGGTLLNHIKEYNDKIIELQNDGIIKNNIKKIENVYILYRAITGEKLDDDYEDAGLKCYRYFDLDDNAKDILYKKRDIDEFPCYKCIKSKKKERYNNCTAKHCYKTIK